MKRYLLFGTDTDVGKSYAAAALCAALLRTGARVAACKPVETGAAEQNDLGAIQALVRQDERLTCIRGIRLTLAAAPSAAARAQSHEPITAARCAAIVRAAENGMDAIVVETCGGGLTPLSEFELVADLAAHLPNFERVLVAGLRLGVLSHAFGIAHYLRSIHHPLHRVVLCDRFGESPRWYVDSTIEDLGHRGLRVEAYLPFRSEPHPDQLAAHMQVLIVGSRVERR